MRKTGNASMEASTPHKEPEKEIIMKSNLRIVGEQNEQLKHENESLRMDNLLVDQNLQFQSKELNQLKSELDILNHEHKKQNELVKTLSDRLVCLSDLQNKNVELIRENLLLRQNSSLSLESIKLVEEHATLQLQNMILRAQKDALCGKLVRDGQLKKQSSMNNYQE
ncbi:hypothetical protein SLEP1_g34174 [Rubroshorea leprosula]|uniref:Uncharacterized protein n=1 Tax=Rubroshorea leprosula TaxID=152421 RepID=A0AAV5KJA5_9ROSI|nr:hypothetical protein SLEP1_g34174 [Rubroshorea leprosula]